MSIYSVANASIEFTGEKRPDVPGERTGVSEICNLTTTDGLKAEVSVQYFDDGEINVRLTEFLTTPPPTYSHLNRNGTMTVQTRETDGKQVALLRALRPGGREHATLNVVTFQELDALLGADTKEWLIGLGFEVGTWASLNPKAAKHKESIAVAIDPNKTSLLVLPWALTRVIALMKRLGKPSLDAL